MKNLQNSEVVQVVGGRFMPGVTRRLNNFFKPAVENGVMRDIGKGLERVGQAVADIVDEIEITGAINADGQAQGEVIVMKR